MTHIDCSIVVCTYNNADSLRLTLDSLAKLRVDALQLETIIVDNNCSDHTPEIAAAWTPPFPKIYLSEPRQGLSWARNAGLAAARGDVIAFTDDDVTVDPNWAVELVRAFLTTGCDAAGGKILPHWAAPVPSWLTPDLYGILALLDHGDTPTALDEPYLFGANFAFRRDVRERHAFGVELGKTGAHLASMEDLEMLRTVHSGGGTLIYWPAAVVHHRIPRSRMTKAYFRRWHRHLGEMQARLAPADIRRALFGVPYHVYRTVMSDALRLTSTRLRARNGFADELNLIRLAGFAQTRMRLYAGRRKPRPRLADQPKH